MNIHLTEDGLFEEKLWDVKLPGNILYQYNDVFCNTCDAEIGRFIAMVMTDSWRELEGHFVICDDTLQYELS